MSIVAIIVKIMPDSPEQDLEKIKSSAKGILESEGAQNISFEERHIAFGLKAVMIKFAWPEEKDGSVYEDKLSAIEGVSSATTADYRRAFG
ncbi:MAG: elongation factor 1-beta [Nanoarchaeota archaeon]|nr:elongation factor 1-beta [Nanoarchaeota archaeon]MBU1052041.1 elongation factor 1-beta [Nanoarchaeota archaeon]MBU1988732.1 elongation factor 1-beta [Nanoarchaeota archaeon]